MAATPKGERRRQALVEAAAALFDEGGFDALKHRAVAERAGLPLASTTYYFDSLDELVTAAVEHHGRAELAAGRERLAALRDSPDADADVVEFVLDALLGPSTAGTEATVLRYERFVAAARRPWLATKARELRVELDALLLEALAHSPRFDAESAADRERLDLLVAVVDGAVVNALIEASPDPRGAARRMLQRAL